MHPCVTCGCSARQGSTVVAFLSTVFFIMQLIVVSIFGNGENEPEKPSTDKHAIKVMPSVNPEAYYGLVAVNVVMLLLCILMFIGVRYRSLWMLVPWIIVVLINDVGYLVLIIATLVYMINGYHVLYLTAFVATIFIFLLLTYFLWIVLFFFFETFGERTNFYRSFGGSGKDDDGTSRIYDGEAAEETPVKKYFFNRMRSASVTK